MNSKLRSQKPEFIKLLRNIAENILISGITNPGKVVEITLDSDPTFIRDGVLAMNKVVEEATYDLGNLSSNEKNSWALSRIITDLGKVFKDIGEVKYPLHERWEPMRIKLPLVINQPKKFYKLAEKLGIEVDTKFAPVRKIKLGPSDFREEPGEIVWGNKIIPLEYGSIQYSICKFAYQEPPRKVISWDIVSSFVDGHEKDESEAGEKSIYNAIRSINKKVRALTRKPLFHWENHSFYRIA